VRRLTKGADCNEGNGEVDRRRGGVGLGLNGTERELIINRRKANGGERRVIRIASFPRPFLAVGMERQKP
jgi:hypothetical protein